MTHIPRDWLFAPSTPAWKAKLIEIAERHGVTREDILGHRRFTRIVHARWEYWHYLVRERGWSLMQAAMNTKHDHTSVLHGVRQHEKRIQEMGE